MMKIRSVLILFGLSLVKASVISSPISEISDASASIPSSSTFENDFFSKKNTYFHEDDLERATAFKKRTEYPISFKMPSAYMRHRIRIDNANLSGPHPHDLEYIQKCQTFLESLYAVEITCERLSSCKREMLDHIFVTNYFTSAKSKKSKIGSNAKNLNLFYPIVFDALKKCADVLTGLEAVAIARAYPLLFSTHYDFVAKIQDFSAFNADDIKKCTDPVKHFSLILFPMALKTLQVSALIEVLNQWDFDLQLPEFRAIVEARGARELINSPEFSQNPLAFRLMTMFLPFELDSALKFGADIDFGPSDSVSTFDLSNSQPPWIHKHFGNVLNSDRVISILGNSKISNKQVKMAVLSYFVMIESHIGIIFTVLIDMFSEALKYEQNIREVKFLEFSQLPFENMKEAFAERQKLLSAITASPRALKDNSDLYNIPFDPLVRDSLIISMDESTNFPSFEAFADSADSTDTMKICAFIWHQLKGEKSELPYDIELIKEKYSSSNQHGIILEWTKLTADTFIFKSGPTAELFLSIVTADLYPQEDGPLYNISREFVSKNVIRKRNYAGLTENWNFDPSFNQERVYMDELEDLSVEYFDNKNSYIQSAEPDESIWMKVRLAEIALINRIRSLHPDDFVQIITTEISGPSLSRSFNIIGSVFSDELVELMLECQSGIEFLKSHRQILHNFSDYSTFTHDAFLNLNIEIDSLTRGLYSVPLDAILKMIEKQNGFLNFPVSFLEGVNPASWNNEMFFFGTSLILAQSLFSIVLNDMDSPLFDQAMKFPEMIKYLYENREESSSFYLNVIMKWIIAWEMNFRTFSLLLSEKKYNSTVLHAAIFKVLSIEFSIRFQIHNTIGKQPELANLILGLIGFEERVKFFLDNWKNSTFRGTQLDPDFDRVMTKLYPAIGSKFMSQLLESSNDLFKYIISVLAKSDAVNKWIWMVNLLMVTYPSVDDMTKAKCFNEHKIPKNLIEFSMKNGTIPLSTAIMLHRQKAILDARKLEEERHLEARKEAKRQEIRAKLAAANKKE